MAYEQKLLEVGFTASEDMAEAYVVVTLGTNAGDVDLAGATDNPLGVIQSTADEGESVPVRVLGITKIVANGAFSKGDLLGVAAATGRVDTISGLDSSFDGGTATMQRPIGVALEAASAAGEIVTMLISPHFFPWG